MAVKEAHAGTALTIDLDAIRDNYRLLRAKASGAACAAVLKADAYGMGASRRHWRKRVAAIFLSRISMRESHCGRICRRMPRSSCCTVPCRGPSLKVVQVDTGMSPAEMDGACSDPDFLRGIALRYLMSHLACAAEIRGEATEN